MRTFRRFHIRPEPRERTYDGVLTNRAALGYNIGQDCYVFRNLAVAQNGTGSDAAVRANSRLST